MAGLGWVGPAACCGLRSALLSVCVRCGGREDAVLVYSVSLRCTLYWFSAALSVYFWLAIRLLSYLFVVQCGTLGFAFFAVSFRLLGLVVVLVVVVVVVCCCCCC